MSSSPDRNIWIRSRVPQNLPCSQCGRTAKFVGLQEPDHYEYNCTACRSKLVMTLTQINALESNRFHRNGGVIVPPIITNTKSAHHMKS
jgi:DNA-directed RNA polymerase subunit RPC12/RpoP